MKLSLYSFALFACLCALLTTPALADTVILPDGTITTASALEAEATPSESGADSDIAGACEIDVTVIDGEGTIGEMDLSSMRRRCTCQNQCFSDTFCQLFAPGKVCRAVGRCRCLKCVNP